MFNRTTAYILIAALAAALGLWAALTVFGPAARAPLPELQTVRLFDPPRTLPAFDLVQSDGSPLEASELQGHWTLVFLGFTHCPDVCPTTLADAAQAMKQLGPDADRVQVLLVTVDPGRDTQKVLADYVTAFDLRFLGMVGDLEATRRAAKEFKVYFEKRPGKAPDDYSIDHSAQSYVIDPQGRLRLFVRHDRIAEDLAHDLRVLLN
jgi:protein SCO1/2